MSPTAFVRRPNRWIRAISDGCAEGRVVTAAPNFAYEWAAQRGLPPAGETLDLSRVTMIIGSEPVSMAAIDSFTEAFAPHGLPHTAIKPSYGIAEDTLFIADIHPDARPTATHFDRDRLAAGEAVVVAADAPNAVAHVSCGTVARSLRAIVVNPDTGQELPDGRVGEFWLHGDNVGRGYWNRPVETRRQFHARLVTPLAVWSRAEGVPADADWLRTGDLGMFFGGQLFVTGRMVDLLTIDGRNHYPQDIEVTAADASALVRRGYVAAISAPCGEDGREQLVIVAERATGTSRSDPGPAITSVREVVCKRHGVEAADVLLLPAGGIPRTTSGKVARRATRDEYLRGTLSGRTH
jgi:fatty-acyl-CoA synthase